MGPEEADLLNKKAVAMHKNMAGNKAIAEKAVRVATDCLRDWEQNTHRLRRIWMGVYYMLAGNTLDRGSPEDVSIPELYKIVETAVPRIEEMILEHDPWFTLRGREKMDETEAETYAAFIDYLFDKAKLIDLVQPAIRDQLICQFAMFKGYWRRTTCERVRRQVHTDIVDGKIRYRITAKKVEEVDYDGVEWRLCDPTETIIDTEGTDPQNMLYVGDRQKMGLSQILRYGKMLGWKNLDQAKEAAGSMGRDGLESKWPRDTTGRDSSDGRRFALTADREYEVVTLYVRDALEDDGVIRDYEIVVVGQSLCVCVRRNVHDDQIRPYACYRTVRNGHGFFGVGQIDNGVRLNQHLDRISAMRIKQVEFGTFPLILPEGASDLPDSMFKAKPFDCIPNAGVVRFTQIADGAYAAGVTMTQEMQRHMEEVCGVSKLQMGQDMTGSTATEANIAWKEGGRRLRANGRGFGLCMAQILDITAKLIRQNVDDRMLFHVLGKRAQVLQSGYGEITPTTLSHDVVFEVVGLKSLSKYGGRSAGMQTFLNAGMPLIAANPGNVDQLQLLYDAADDLVGRDFADRIVRIPEDPETIMPAENENAQLAKGIQIGVHELDDHEDHILQHVAEFNDLVSKNPNLHQDVMAAFVVHTTEHVRRRDIEAARQKQLDQRADAQGPEAGGDVGESGESPAAGAYAGPESGRDAGRFPGRNPGPTDTNKVAKAGRAPSGVSQMEANR